ncbi:MAG: helix-turn-helix domain-containing protein, partial [Thermoanaerobaculia bacterium]
MSVSRDLASNLRYIRDRRGLTQAQLAHASSVPRSTIASIETGSGNPTLVVLTRLAAALSLSIEELLSRPHGRGKLWKRGTLPVERRGKGRLAEVQKLLPEAIPGMAIDRIALEPGARMTGIPHKPGTREFLACERGRVTLWTLGDRFDLDPGDVVSFQGDQPHSYWNDGRVAAVGFSVVALAPP